MDKVLLYPKTSCPCGECKNTYPAKDFSTGSTENPRTNLAFPGCKVSPYFDCYDRAQWMTSIQPRSDISDIYELNPQAYTNKLAEGFGKLPCQVAGTSCPKPSWVSRDPRQFDSPRADWLPLDRPPMDGNVRLKDVYSPQWDGYGVGFTPYERVADGQIVYYIDRSIQDAFYKPVWSEPAKETSVMYVDPMGAVKPQYIRTPLINTENPTVTSPTSYPYCLSFLQDTQSFREDLMSIQQQKNNNKKWSARWTSMSS